jgi:site-specific DNA recombinase
MEGFITLFCAIYARYSSKLQSMGISIDFQLTLGKSVIEENSGILIDQFIDREKSGYHLSVKKRPEMVRLLEAIRSGRVNCVVFYDESRLSRKLLDFYTEFLDPILEINPDVKFIKSSTGKEWDPNSDEARYNLIAALKESENKARNARIIQNHALEQKERPGALLPLGIEAIGKDKIITNKDIIIVLFIFHLASWGYSQRKIASVLNDMKLEVRGNIKENWKHSSIHGILNNHIYIGIASWNRRKSRNNSSPKDIEEITIYNRFENIIPMQLWNIAHFEIKRKAIIKDNKGQEKRQHIRMETSFSLSSIIQCAICEEFLETKNSLKKIDKLKTKKGSPLKYYFCPNCEYKLDSNETENKILDLVKSQLHLYFTEFMIEKKIKEWNKYLNHKLEEENQNLELYKLKCLNLEGLRNKLSQDHFKNLHNLANSEVQIITNLITEIHVLKDELKNLQDMGLLRCVGERIQNLNSTDMNVIELRYVLFSTLEKLLVCTNKQGSLKIESIEFKSLPIPIFNSKISNL